MIISDMLAESLRRPSTTVGDIISIIEMCTRQQSDDTWWKAKLTISAGRTILPTEDENANAFKIGYFPSDCVQLFEDKGLPSSSPPSAQKYSHFAAARRVSELLKRGVRRRNPVFGVDLDIHLEKTNRKVPLILEKCVAAIEKHGIVTGIYRQCGIQSNIQRLRAKFDSGCEPDLFEFAIVRDIYCVSSLLKQYFRQLPNPLFTFQLYSRLLEAYDCRTEEEKIRNLKNVLEMMPSSHYHTARYLLRHLSRLCGHTSLTDMTSRNLAIVWAPNLFRAPPTISGIDSHLLNGLNVHTALCNFLIEHTKEVFGDESTDEIENSLLTSSVLMGSASLPRRHASFNESVDEDAKSKKSGDFRWSRVFRGKSVDGLIGGFTGRRRTINGSAGSERRKAPPKEERVEEKVKWRRSHSTDAAFRATRSESILSMMTKGYEELRDGVRSWTKRAYSLRPGSRPPASPSLFRLPHERMQESVTISSISRASTNDRFDRDRREIAEESPTTSCSGSFVLDRTAKEKRVAFRNIDRFQEPVEFELPLGERSSPVEEWSSDSRNSLHLEVSRYDNVSPSRPRDHVIDRSGAAGIALSALIAESAAAAAEGSPEFYDNHAHDNPKLHLF